MQRTSKRTHRSRLPLVVLVLPLFLGAAADVDENRAAFFGVEAPPCYVRSFASDKACPGCGLTRSTALAVQGEWSRAWMVHPAGILIAALCAVGLAIRFWMRVDPRRASLHEVLRRQGPMLLAVGMLAAWVVRLIR